jgi:hypothetical protein
MVKMAQKEEKRNRHIVTSILAQKYKSSDILAFSTIESKILQLVQRSTSVVESFEIFSKFH